MLLFVSVLYLRSAFVSRFSLLLLTAALLGACNRSADAPAVKPLSKTEKQALTRQFTGLRDSLNASWARMTADDDEKIFYTNRLLDELSHVPGLDASRIAQARAANDRLRARRYQMGTMVSDSIDAYDNAQAIVLAQVMQLVAQNPDPDKYRLVGELAQDIQLHDDRVIHRRNDFDKVARIYNVFLYDHRRDVPAAKDAPQMPLFALEK